MSLIVLLRYRARVQLLIITWPALNYNTITLHNHLVFLHYVVIIFYWYVCYGIDVMAPVILDWRLVCSYGHLF